MQDENTDNVCKLDLENIYGEFHEPPARINVVMLRHLYELPFFAASADDEGEEVVDVQTWHELCIVARRLGIPSLTTKALEQLDMYFEKKLVVDEKIGLLRDRSSITWFVRNVQLETKELLY